MTYPLRNGQVADTRAGEFLTLSTPGTPMAARPDPDPNARLTMHRSFSRPIRPMSFAIVLLVALHDP